LCATMKAADVTATLDLALRASGLEKAKPADRPKLLSDNGSSYAPSSPAPSALFFSNRDQLVDAARKVRKRDLALALLEIFSNLTALVVSFAVFYAIGAIDVPRDLPMFYLGYFYMIWWSVAAAMIIGALCERTDWVSQVWIPYSYLFMMFSGFFYLADWLPPGLRNVALYQPYTQAYEMIRAGVFGRTIMTYGDPGYTTFALAILTLFGLWLMREGRKYVVIE